MPGLYFEQFSVGQRFDHAIRRTITEADNVFFSALTHNPQPTMSIEGTVRSPDHRPLTGRGVEHLDQLVAP